MYWVRYSTVVARIRRNLALFSMTCALAAALSGQASATLIQPSPARAYPDVSADVNGVVNYTYNASTQSGSFQLTNTPYLLAGGPTASSEFDVTPDAQGLRQQTLSIALDQNGNFVTSSSNSYQLWGTVTAGGQTYSGLLLQGVPTAFGSQYRAPTGSQGSAIFDTNINITGGALASVFGPDVYMSIQPELGITFAGSFAQNFTADKATSNTRAYHAPSPFPAPEPTTLALLIAGCAGALYVRRRARAV
jgi:hypothetical protein